MDVLRRLAGRVGPVRLTGRGIAFLAAAFVGLIASYAAGWPALLAIALFLGAAVVAAVIVVVASPPMLEVERRIDPAVVEQRAAVRVRVSVRGSAAGAFEWSEELPRSVVVDGRAEGRLDGVRPGRAAALIEYEFRARVRGEVPVGPLRVLRTDPLGLARVQRRVGGVDRVVVLPMLHPVVPPSAVQRTDPDPRSTAAFGAFGDQRDIVSRGYRPGDPLRSVDWRATAHRGALMVRSEAAASTSATGLVLDPRAEAWPEAAAFEWALEYCASLVQALDDRGAGVRVAVGAAPVDDVVEALVGLATAHPAHGAPEPGPLAGAVARGEVRIVQVLTGDGDPASLLRLPPLPHGAIGVAVVVSRRAAVPEVPAGWRAVRLDPTSPVERARVA